MPLVTLADWVEATRRHTTSGRQNERNTLGANYTAGSGTLTLAGPLGGIVPGSRISIGLNVFYVSAVSAVGLVATVIGGQEGSTDVNASTGALVRVNPTVTDFEIVEALAADLADLSSPTAGLYGVAALTLVAPYSRSLVGMELTPYSDVIISILEVRWMGDLTDQSDWVTLNQIDYTFQDPGDPAAFPSGKGLLINGGACIANGAIVQVVATVGFTAPVALTDPLSATGLPTTAYDLPPIGAAMRLIFPREVRRNETKTQGDTRRAGEVPPGAILNSARGLAAFRATRIQSEMQRLLARYPSRRW